MPFDGVVAKCMAIELNSSLSGGRIEKIYQPQRDEIVLHILSQSGVKKLLLCTNPSCPRIHITGTANANPEKPPMFCMLLRKHLSGGTIRKIGFYDYERVLDLQIEARNEMGDSHVKRLVIEIMSRRSNVILLDENGIIIDSIRHVDDEMSRIREIMPGMTYVPPPSQEKDSPDSISADKLMSTANESHARIERFLLDRIKGFSPLLCRLICQDAGIDDNRPAQLLSGEDIAKLTVSLDKTIKDIREGSFRPYYFYSDESSARPLDFHCVSFSDLYKVKYTDSLSQLLDQFYFEQYSTNMLAQKKSATLKRLHAYLHKLEKKSFAQQSEIEESKNMDEYRLFGELITANIHNIPKQSSCARLLNYYSENEEYVNIPMDKNLSPQENAQKYFKLYSKAKSTYRHATVNLKATVTEIEYIENVQHQISSCDDITQLIEILDELAAQRYIPRSGGKKTARKNASPSVPLHFISSDGIDIYVGRNNRQNDLLTLKLSSPEDLWLHTKNIPGSHVVVSSKSSLPDGSSKSSSSVTVKSAFSDIGIGTFPDSTIEEAALLAAYHSKSRMSSNVPVDITKIKYLKKPGGLKPGLVLYDNYKTVYVTPDENKIGKLKIVSAQ